MPLELKAAPQSEVDPLWMDDQEEAQDALVLYQRDRELVRQEHKEERLHDEDLPN